ncbi:MAG: VWA domain-containing protein [Chitinophagaceae bacterium]|nr:MAG: VWA domain-containing protein [Chitinophagaceae bacterium]
MDFAYPYVFGLLLLVPFMVYWYITRSARMDAKLQVSTVQSFRKTGSWKSVLRHVPFVLRTLAVICLIIALARPQTRNDEELKSGEGIDIVLCMDVSGSMLAQDFSPNRLEASKQVAAEFVDNRATDRIALVIFAGESFTACPLTTDKNMLKSQIFAAQSSILADGTAIGDGITTSVERLKGSANKSKIIILLTDGDNQGGLIDPTASLEIAKSFGIKIYTIGVGSEGYAETPVQAGGGAVVIQRQRVNLNEQLLRDIAGGTGGLYFRARDNASLRNIYVEIDKLEKSKVEITALRRYTERFFPFALAALALLVLEMGLRLTVLRKFP